MTRSGGGRSTEVEHPRSTGEPLDDDALIAALRVGIPRGDTTALDLLIARHEGHVRANCTFIVRDPEAARDLAQEVFVKAFFGLGSFRGDATFRTWIRRIKVNHCLNHLARARPPSLDIDDPALQGEAPLRVDPDLDLDQDDRRAAVAAVLVTLTDTLRIPLVLRDLDGYDYDEIAELLGVKVSAAKMRVMRGREQFREVWLERFGAAP